MFILCWKYFTPEFWTRVCSKSNLKYYFFKKSLWYVVDGLLNKPLWKADCNHVRQGDRTISTPKRNGGLWGQCSVSSLQCLFFVGPVQLCWWCFDCTLFCAHWYSAVKWLIREACAALGPQGDEQYSCRDSLCNLWEKRSCIPAFVVNCFNHVSDYLKQLQQLTITAMTSQICWTTTWTIAMGNRFLYL